jgi:hypothetical protein
VSKRSRDTTFDTFISIVGLTRFVYNIISAISLILSNSDGYLVHLRRILGYPTEISAQNRQWVNYSRDTTFVTFISIVGLTPFIYNIPSTISLILSNSDGYLVHLRRIPGYTTENGAQKYPWESESRGSTFVTSISIVRLTLFKYTIYSTIRLILTGCGKCLVHLRGNHGSDTENDTQRCCARDRSRKTTFDKLILWYPMPNKHNAPYENSVKQ